MAFMHATAGAICQLMTHGTLMVETIQNYAWND